MLLIAWFLPLLGPILAFGTLLVLVPALLSFYSDRQAITRIATNQVLMLCQTFPQTETDNFDDTSFYKRKSGRYGAKEPWDQEELVLRKSGVEVQPNPRNLILRLAGVGPLPLHALVLHVLAHVVLAPAEEAT